MNELFNVNMTSSEARLALLAAGEGKTKKERDEIFKAYVPIASIIGRREIQRAADGWMS